MDTWALTLPPELKHHIAIFCTPGSLASLAQVHTSYQVEAEHVLYRHLAIRSSSDYVALNTLKDCPRKALLVRSLTVEFPLAMRWKLEDVCPTTTLLCDALRHTEALIDLRIRLPYQEDDTLKAQFNQVLRERHFKLRTLYCNGYLDVVDITAKQPDLQIIGIYSKGGWDDVIDILERMRVAPRLHPSMPTLFAFQRDSWMSVFNNVAICTICATDGLYPWGTIAESIDRDVAYDISLERSEVNEVRIYLEDFSDMAFIRRLVEEMVQVFPTVDRVRFVPRCPFRVGYSHSEHTAFELISKYIQPLSDPDLVSILAPITLLREVAFVCLPGRVSHGSAVLSNDAKIALAEEWTGSFPWLVKIVFFDGSILGRRLKRWEILSSN